MTAEETRDRRWWLPELTEEDRGKRMLTVVERIREQQMGRKEHDIHRLRRYSSSVTMANYGYAYVRPALAGNRRRISFNVIKNCADTFVAKVTKEKPKVSIVTSGGDWELQQKAKSMDKFIEGVFYETKVYTKSRQVVLDGGGIFGTGFLHPYIAGSGKSAHIQIERVLPWEMLCDDQEGATGDPQNMYREKMVPRATLEELFEDEPEKLQAIKRLAEGAEKNAGAAYDRVADEVRVAEGWHLKAGRGMKPGRHLMAIHGCTLVDEEWDYEWFPFVTYQRQESPLGFWGISLCDDLEGIQDEINTLLIRIQKAMNLLGAGHVLINQASKVNFSKWDNEIGSKITYTGEKPTIDVPGILVSPEVYAHLDRLDAKAYQTTGIPQPQAQGQGVPDQIESGKGQQVYLAITDQRMQVAINSYHEMFVELGKHVIALGREIVKHHNSQFAMKAAVGSTTMKKVLLSENDLAEDEYILQRWPTRLSSDPADREATVEKWANAGWIAPDQAKRLLDFPDLEEAANLENASYNLVEDMISEMITEGRYMPPLPFMNIGTQQQPGQAVIQVTQRLLKAWRDHVPEDRLQLLRDWLEDAKTLVTPKQTAMTPAAMASAGGTPVAAAPAPGVTPMMMPPGGAPPPPPGAAPIAA